MYVQEHRNEITAFQIGAHNKESSNESDRKTHAGSAVSDEIYCRVRNAA